MLRYVKCSLTGKHSTHFKSHHLSSAKQNHDVGDQEVLVIKLTSEEWRHWLESMAQPFIVWTDHKNLAYLQSAKHLNT